jgi:hypothetical protein
MNLIPLEAQLDLESPWMFQLRNPSNPAASTHAGVLEFIAEEGVVHLPYWVCPLFPDPLLALTTF